jgi:cation transport ATPase
MAETEVKTGVPVQTTFAVKGMSCAACQSFVQKRLEQQPGVTHAAVNLLLHEANVAYDPATTTLNTLLEAVRSSGYGAEAPDLRVDATESRKAGAADEARGYRHLRLQAIASLTRTCLGCLRFRRRPFDSACWCLRWHCWRLPGAVFLSRHWLACATAARI